MPPCLVYTVLGTVSRTLSVLDKHCSNSAAAPVPRVTTGIPGFGFFFSFISKHWFYFMGRGLSHDGASLEYSPFRGQKKALDGPALE